MNHSRWNSWALIAAIVLITIGVTHRPESEIDQDARRSRELRRSTASVPTHKQHALPHQLCSIVYLYAGCYVVGLVGMASCVATRAVIRRWHGVESSVDDD